MKKENLPISVTKSSICEMQEYFNEISILWDTKILTNNGKLHQLLEKNLKDFLDTKELTIFTNGHIALEYALSSLESNGEVITTPFTFISTTNSIVRAGLKPVFCDIEDQYYNIDTNKLESLITKNTVAILPVHVYGNPCNVQEIENIAKKHNLKVIYDAAHAFGVKINGESIGNFGDISMFSFHATKVFNTIEGGALTFKNPLLKVKFETLKNFGIINAEEAGLIGGNGKMDEFRSAMGICNLRHFDDEIEKRKIIVEKYRSRLSNIRGIKLIEPPKNVTENYAYFPVVFNGYKKTRDMVFIELLENGIHSRKYFYPLITDFEAYNKVYDSEKTPIARYISSNVLALPLYADLDLESVDFICEIIKK